jgi:23S rRNA-/tRNA-specific pseudouridylate synthase
MRDQFAARTVKKTYLALVEGMIAVGGTLEHDLAHDPTVPFCRMVDAARARFHVTESFHAVTSYQPIGFTKVGNEERTLLEVTILTGVTHQIRAQLSFAGIHIINDRLYGAFAIENQEGHCLHALAASFVHPVKGVECQIRTPYPEWARIEP